MERYFGFWKDLPRPAFGLSPMDGITDAPFRYLTAKYGAPDVMYTEFVNVEGLSRGAIQMLRAFEYSDIERPIVAQIYGTELESFYKVAIICCALGFDGIDINMGCPAKKVSERGAGAGMIRTPDHAKAVIQEVLRGVSDWANGITFQEADIRPKVYMAVERQKNYTNVRKKIPVSVKTRTGYDTPVAEEWIEHLLETPVAHIAMHGRTLKQMYTGESQWEVLARAGKIVQSAGVTFYGNGDITSLEDGKQRVKTYGLSGALIGRAAMGNPWVFSQKEVSYSQRIEAAKEHSYIFQEMFPDVPFSPMRKHLACYIRDFPHAAEIRHTLMQAASAEEVASVLDAAQALDSVSPVK